MKLINQESTEDETGDWYKVKYTNGGLAFLWLVILMFLIFQTYKFFKVYKLKNKLLLAFLVMLNITLLL